MVFNLPIDIGFGISPPFDRFEETDEFDDHHIMKTANDNFVNESSCKVLDHVLGKEIFPPILPDIVALNLFSDGKTLNYTTWFKNEAGKDLINKFTMPRLPLITINVDQFQNETSIESYLDKHILNFDKNNNNFKLLERSQINISGLRVEKLMYNLTDFITNKEAIQTKYLVVTDGKIYDIVQHIPSEKYLDDISKIIKSFTSISSYPTSINTDYRDNDLNPNEDYYKYNNNMYNFSLNIPKDWKISNGSWGLFDFEIYSPEETIIELGRQYELTLDVLQKNNQGIDFVERILWDPETKSWTSLLTERPGSQDSHMKIIKEKNNITDFYHNSNHSTIVDELLKIRQPNYITSSLDLGDFGYPSKYGIIFTTINIYQVNDAVCKVVDNLGPITLPPPYFNINLNPRTINLYPYDESDVEMNFTTNNPWDWSLSFNSNLSSPLTTLSEQKSNNIKIEFAIPETTLVSDSKFTTKINVKVSNASIGMHLIPVTVKAQLNGISMGLPDEYISYPQEKSLTYLETVYLKVNVLKPTPPENPLLNAVYESIASGEIWKYSLGAFATLAVIITGKIRKARKFSKQKTLKKWFNSTKR
ncbi:MAG: hypothetical protein AB7V56_06875 [Candidatus Nitrosocosmicus sp.]